MTSYQPPVVTVDVVAFRVVDFELQVAAVRRAKAPFVGERALPGVYMAAGQQILESAERALRDKAGASRPDVRTAVVTGVHDSVARDPRGHALSIVVVVLDPDLELARAEWLPARRVVNYDLAFDHESIVERALQHVSDNLLHPAHRFVRSLHGSAVPTTASLKRVLEAVYGQALDTSNLRRSLVQSGIVVETDERVSQGVGRPARVWRWADRIA